MRRMAIALALLAAGIGGALAQGGDAAAGATVFKKCMSCHAIGEGAKTKVGPELNGVVGRPAGSIADFKYSQAMLDAGKGGLVWSPETLTQFLHKPRDFVKGTKMTFPGLDKPEDIANVIAYLATFPPPPAQ